MKKFLLAGLPGCLAALLTVSTALAQHPRPEGASPLNFRLVPVFAQCIGSTPAGMTHGPSLAVPSCSPPIEQSNFLTMDAPDRPAPYNLGPDGTGLITLKVTCLVAGTTTQVTGPNANPPCADPGDQIDVKISITVTGMRCVAVSGGCVAPGGLYGGKVLGSADMRITDHYNQQVPNPVGPDCSDTNSCAGTAVDLPFDIGTQCTAGACNYVTSTDLILPGFALELKRAVVGLGAVEVQDAGADGDMAGGPSCPPTCAQNDTDYNRALTQGMFVP